MDAMADDVIELLDALQVVEPVVLGGPVDGGIRRAGLMLRYPDRFRALMLIDTRAAADTPEAAQDREELARAVESTGSTEAVVEAMLPKLFSEPPAPTARADRADPGGDGADLAAGRRRALRGMAPVPTARADLAKITVPTLVMVGEEDAIAPPEEARAMAEALPDAPLEVIPDAGHLAPLENPDGRNEAMLGSSRAGMNGESSGSPPSRRIRVAPAPCMPSAERDHPGRSARRHSAIGASCPMANRPMNL